MRYSGLFEDEVGALLRDLSDSDIISTSDYTTYRKRQSPTFGDGIISKDEDYDHFIAGKYAGTVNKKYMLSALCHTTFTID